MDSAGLSARGELAGLIGLQRFDIHLAMKLLVRNLLFTLIVPGTVGVYLPFALTRGLRPRWGPMLLLALPLFATGAALYAWSVWNFGRQGRGTPLPTAAPVRLVVTGPFRYTRNPMYLALFMALLGWILLYQTSALFLYCVGVLVAVNFFVLGYEEPHLRQVFGDAYDEYADAVPRWLPRIRT